ncbi:hypothetical protein GE09DRAFT_1108450 [Coniochaeta sp. 2T2.1]|nr:hypothetical protein GE09DRAFT_1108450 [Coniochaeta sp. 2T2.1]
MASKSHYSTGDAWTDAINQMYAGTDSDMVDMVKQLWTDDCKITIQGSEMNVAGLIQYLKQIREAYNSVKMKSVHCVRDGKLFAEKHIATGHLKSGSTTVAEVVAMCELNEDGRAVWFEETVRFISGELGLEEKA